MKFLPIATSLLIGGSLAVATSTSNPASSSVSSRNGSSKAARAMAHEAYEKKFPEIKKRCSKKKGSGGSSNASGAASSSGSQSGEAGKYAKTGKSGSDSSSGSKSSSSGSSSNGKGSGSSSGAQSSGSQGSESSGSHDDSSDSSSSGSANGSKDGSGSGSASGSGSSGGSSNSGGNSGGDMSSKSGQCGSSDASGSSPNGSKSFLNCGVDSGGWKPANVKLSDLKIISDEQAASSSVFQPCQKYASEFKSAASSTGIPAAILMSIAMQESTCNPNANGSRGEVGMMQITSDKCDGAPGGNCHDTEFNIKKGGSYLKSQIDAMGGSFLAALGGYNGWYEGMKASGSCGPDGQNLNYLNGMLNGFAQGKDGYGSVMGAC